MERVPVSHALVFIETPMFTRQIKLIATDDELKELQKELIESPGKGDLIQKTGGLRKVRWQQPPGKKGKCQSDLLSGDQRGDLSGDGLSEKH
jgi:hypothetical protein